MVEKSLGRRFGTLSLQTRAAAFAIVADDVTMVTILVDHGERSSGVPAYLRCLGIGVEYRALDVSDYIVGASTGIERKSISDLHRSIANGRLWRQVGALRSAFATSYLLVEGKALYDGQVSPAGLRGALLAVVDSGVRLVWARSSRDAANWIYAIASRAAGDQRRSRSRRQSVRTPASFLALVPGVSPAIAAELVRRFGSVAAVAQACDEDLLAVPGVGPVRVAALRSILA
jgi:ERCC4-type nuclease